MYKGRDDLKEVEFGLMERGADGNIVTIKYSGCFLIVNNGYLKWSTTVPPSKHASHNPKRASLVRLVRVTQEQRRMYIWDPERSVAYF